MKVEFFVLQFVIVFMTVYLGDKFYEGHSFHINIPK